MTCSIVAGGMMSGDVVRNCKELDHKMRKKTFSISTQFHHNNRENIYEISKA